MLTRFYKVFEWAILGIVFFGVIAPIALFIRLLGCDHLYLKLHDTQKSYWIECAQVKLNPKNFHAQFIKR